ncbi:MAG: hypothetical protein M1830_004102 [Pleopsidium flavum]|nr:MAG: hypothetical protein M1830_004102 [Pleopsidium flavum]
MSSETPSIQAPYTIAHLPRPLEPIHGKTFVSDVHSLVGSRKRKRNEIAIATDGESINLYDLFSENVAKSGAQPPLSIGAVAASVSYNIPESSHSIVHIDVVPVQAPIRDSKDAFDIIAVHQDGELRCLSGDLDAQRWHARIGPLIAADVGRQFSTIDLQVEYAMVIDAETAGKGLLKERADLRAMLGGELAMRVISGNATMLFLITSWKDVGLVSTKCRSFNMFSIRGNQSHFGSGKLISSTPSLQHMQSVTLPESATTGSALQLGPQFMLHPSSGTLYQSSENGLGIYNLSDTVPRLSSHIHLGHKGPTSFLRLSSSSILSASQTAITVYDTRYRSAQAILPISTSKKSPKNAHNQRPPNQLLSYFSNLGLVLARNEENELLAMQIILPGPRLSGSRKRKRDGLLIDSIGRGTRDPIHRSNSLRGTPRPLGNYLPSSRALDDKRWEEQMAKLDNYVAQQRVDLFESVMAQELGIANEGPLAANLGQDGKSWGKAEKQSSNHGIQLSEPSTNHEAKMPELLDRLHPDPPSSGTHSEHAMIDRRKVLYVLSKMFSLVSTEDQPESDLHHGVLAASRLKVAFFPPHIFYWLVKYGNISTCHVESALRHKEYSTTSPALPSGALTEALLAYDPSLRAMMAILEGPVYFDVLELVHLVRVLLHNLEAKEINGRKLLTNDEGHDVDGFEDSQQCVAANARDDDSLMGKDQSPDHRLLLIAALRKLHSFPVATITQALRKKLTGADRVSLIHQLRIELAEGGWTSWYADGGILPELRHHDHNERIDIISTLLNCAVDSIGMGGWVLGTLAFNDAEEREDMIAYMKAEVSAVLEGLHEATYLRGLLGEMLLYGKSAAMVPRATVQATNDTRGSLKPISMPLTASDSHFLPLSLKAPRNISMTKVGAGGEIQKRSKRDIGRLKSKMVGKYSRERIAI